MTTSFPRRTRSALPRAFVLLVASFLAASTAAPGTAVAQESRPWIDSGFVWTSEALGTMAEMAGSAWNRAATNVLPEAPFDWLPEHMGDRDRDFLAAMQAAGYQLAAGETGGGLLPTVHYRFVLEREPTPVDIERTRTLLEEHRARHWGVKAMGQRAVLRSLIDASGSSAMRVAAVEIGLRPMPWIRYELSAVDRTLEVSERRLLDRLADRAGRSVTQ